MREFPTLQEVLAIHELLIQTFGGPFGIRDMGALEAALMRPQLGYYEGLLDEAAALMESLANNHPFVDCNKRAAFFVTDTFLRLNGSYIEVDPDEAYAYFMGLFERGTFRSTELRAWLERYLSYSA